ILVAGAYLERWGLTLLTSIAAAWFLPELLTPIAGALVSANDAISAWLAEKAAQTQKAAEAASTTAAS
uniref:hypothetical protein n=1 Tax=Candidatus Fimivicinus sp. TaxID=3056640 RepID=UPI003FEDBB1E